MNSKWVNQVFQHFTKNALIAKTSSQNQSGFQQFTENSIRGQITKQLHYCGQIMTSKPITQVIQHFMKNSLIATICSQNQSYFYQQFTKKRSCPQNESVLMGERSCNYTKNGKVWLLINMCSISKFYFTLFDLRCDWILLWNITNKKRKLFEENLV